jgi:hypothetical protein
MIANVVRLLCMQNFLNAGHLYKSKKNPNTRKICIQITKIRDSRNTVYQRIAHIGILAKQKN